MEEQFDPWWVRHRHPVVFGIALVVVLSGWLVAWAQQARHEEPPQPVARPVAPEYGEWDRALYPAAVGDLTRVSPAERVFFQRGEAKPLPNVEPGDWLHSHEESGQTFDEYLASGPNLPNEFRNVLYLQPIGDFRGPSSPSLPTLKRFAEAYFGLTVKLLPPIAPAPGSVRSRKGPWTGNKQWLTGDLHRLLLARLPDDAYAMIGLTMTDLWPGEGWNFVFGEAMLRERVGVYSFARYGPADGDGVISQRDRRLILLRSLKVMSHEIGHMFGILHCTHFACNMNGSNSLEESDRQPLRMCPVDLRKLHYATGLDLTERQTKLKRFYQRNDLGG